MSFKNWPGGVVTKTFTAPTGPYQNGSASGVWTPDQVAYWLKQGLWPIAGNKEIGWATYWDTQNSNWDGGNWMLGGLALTSNSNVFGAFNVFLSGQGRYTALVGCNVSTGSPSYIGRAAVSTNVNPSYTETGCALVSGNNIAVGAYLGGASNNSAPQFSVCSVATPSSPSVSYGYYQESKDTGYNGNQYGLASDGTNVFTAYNAANGRFAVSKYNSGGLLWSYGSTSYSNTYVNLAVNPTYNATHGYGCDIYDSSSLGVIKFDLSTGASAWRKSISPTGSAYFGDRCYTNRSCVASDGSVLVAFGKSANSYYPLGLAKISSDGNSILWAKEIGSIGLPVQIVSSGGFVYVMVRVDAGYAFQVHKINESTGENVFVMYFSEYSGTGRICPMGLAADATNNAVYVGFLTRPTGVYYRTFMWRLPASGAYSGSSAGNVTYTKSTTTYSNLGSATLGVGALAWNSITVNSTSAANGYSADSIASSTTTF